MQNRERKFVRLFEGGDNLDLLMLSDAKLRTDDGCTFDVHRAILARSSDYFRSMFCGVDGGRREFEIPGISGKCLSDILCYVYTGDIGVNRINATDLIIAANYLLLNDLSMEIKKKIGVYMTKDNCLRIFQAAHQIGDGDIVRESFRFIQTRFEGVMRCQKNDLEDLPLEILSSILGDRSLCVYDEATVWRAIVRWTQKDIPVRLNYVPQLLLTLAAEDVGEELATEILQHEIITTNDSLMKKLVEIRSPNGSRQDPQMNQISKRRKISDLDVLLSFLRDSSTRSPELNGHRIPLKLHLMCRGDKDGKFYIYTTYDETPDMWRRILKSTLKPYVLIPIGHNIYIVKMMKDSFTRCDLKTMDLKKIRFRHSCSFLVAIDAYIYVFGKIADVETYNVDAYDTANERWFDGIPLRNITYGSAVAVEKKIYVVGWGFVRVPMMQMFDPITQRWSDLSPPTVYDPSYKLVAYHQKIYLIGHSDVNPQVFDTSTNLWRGLPNLPYTYLSPKALVFNDQILFYDSSDNYKRNAKNVRWNDAKECWEELDETYIIKDFHLLHLQPFCTIDDVETIRIITKQTRNQETMQL